MKTREIEDVIAELSMEEERDLKLVCSRIRSYYLSLLEKMRKGCVYVGDWEKIYCNTIDEMKKKIEE